MVLNLKAFYYQFESQLISKQKKKSHSKISIYLNTNMHK